MEAKEFNLLQEPWIRVLDKENKVQTVSLPDVFARAQDYRDLAGEMPAQDFAMLRFLLAVLYSIFLWQDAEGDDAPIVAGYGNANGQPVTRDDALDRWSALWQRGQFPSQVISAYLEQYEDRFYLFHPQFPFYQVAGLNDGTLNSAAKLNGELSESANKIRLFPCRTGAPHNELTYAEAARWLLYVNGFDDTSAKSKAKGDGSPGAGWLGKLGLLAAQGDNLFETLMYNLALLKDGVALWKDGQAVWELETPRAGIRTLIVQPENPAQLLTLQSRRMLLTRENDRVVSCLLVGGDYFPKENAFGEQMTIWAQVKDDKSVAPAYNPRRHDPAKQLWREFSSLVVEKTDDKDTEKRKYRAPGLVTWLSVLRQESLISGGELHFRTVSIQYGDKDFFVTRAFSDELSFHADLLSGLGEAWSARIRDTIVFTDALASYAGWLAEDLNKAGAGGLSAATAKEQFYARVDMPFRAWLATIDPTNQEQSYLELIAAWHKEARAIARALGEEMVTQAGPGAMKGRYLENKQTKEKRLYCAPDAYNRFLNSLYGKHHKGGSPL